jgi:hypothetical protein
LKSNGAELRTDGIADSRIRRCDHPFSVLRQIFPPREVLRASLQNRIKSPEQRNSYLENFYREDLTYIYVFKFLNVCKEFNHKTAQKNWAINLHTQFSIV